MTTDDRSRSPAVSIGIPTYNRSALLDGAIASAAAQTFADVEIVVSDNCSTDATPDVCARWTARDPRVRVVRHARNLGPTANFNSLFEECRGAFVLMLSDDDRLEADYVETCLARLHADPALATVAGVARFVRDGAPVREGTPRTIDGTDAAARVLAYFRAADDGPFYGVARREAVRAAGAMPNVLANDWLHSGRLAAHGAVAVIPQTHVVRELDGTSASVDSIVDLFGGRPVTARIPHLVMAWLVFSDIAWRAPVHRAGTPGPGRLVLAARCALGVINWPSLAWHLTAPTFLGLARRPRGRPVARVYDRVTRALGAGRQD